MNLADCAVANFPKISSRRGPLQKKDEAGRPGNGLERDASATSDVDHWRDREEFKARVLEWARKLEVDAHAIYIRPMIRKWASCSTAGTLSFNDELIQMPRDLGDYVIVHELQYFAVPNHGKLWQSLMRVHLGDYVKVEDGLKRWKSNCGCGQADPIL